LTRCGCVKISKLEGKRVALWGWGREGRAAFAVLRARLPTLALSLFCPVSEVEAARAETEGALDVRGGAVIGTSSAVIRPTISGRARLGDPIVVGDLDPVPARSGHDLPPCLLPGGF